MGNTETFSCIKHWLLNIVNLLIYINIYDIYINIMIYIYFTLMFDFWICLDLVETIRS